jgi:hypothetical protein
LSRLTQRASSEWIAVVAWLGVIAVESTDLLSSHNTSRFLYPLLTFFFGHIDLAAFWYWHGMARKAGHVLGYGILAVLFFRAWRATLPAPGWSWRWALLAFFMTAVTASLDEWHQTFLPSRTGSLHDVALDSAAAVAALGICWVWSRRSYSSS